MSKPKSIHTEPMNDIGQFPGPETQIAWELGLEPAAARRALEIAVQWKQLKTGSGMFRRCESPIERLLLMGFMMSSSGCRLEWNDDQDMALIHLEDVASEDSPSFLLCAQEHVASLEEIDFGDYEGDEERENDPPFARIDFVLTPYMGRQPWKLAIEADGHEFHERTKQQAAADRERDRRLVRCGYTIIRFTGSEIHADPCGCAHEIIRTANCLANNPSLESAGYREYERGRKRGYLERGQAIACLPEAQH